MLYLSGSVEKDFDNAMNNVSINISNNQVNPVVVPFVANVDDILLKIRRLTIIRTEYPIFKIFPNTFVFKLK